MQKLKFINGNGIEIDLTDKVNFGIIAWEGFSADGLNIQSQQVPFQDGGVFLDALMEQRELSVTVAINAKGDLEKRYRLRRELISVLNPKLGEGVLIYTDNYLSKQIHVIPQIPLFDTNNSNDSGTPKVSCSFTACNPYWEDLEDTVVNIIAQKNVINEGDYKTSVELIIPDEVEDMTFINQTNKQKLQATGLSTGVTKINTGFGKKTVLSEDIGFKFTGGGNYKDVLTIGDKCYILCNDIIVYDILNNSFEDFIIDIQEEERDTSVKEYNINFAYSTEQEVFCVSNSVRGFFISHDLIHWSESRPIQNRGAFYVSYCNGKFYSFIEGVLYSSTDGESWNSLDLTSITTDNGHVCYSSEKSLFVISTSTKVLTSSDGVNWTQATITLPTGGCKFSKVKYLNHRFVIVAGGTSVSTTFNGRLFFSTDGINWDFTDIIDYYFLIDVEYFESENLFVVVGRQRIYISSDFETFIEVYSASTNGNVKFNSICTNPIYNMLFLVGSLGAFLSSAETTTWEKKSFIFEKNDSLYIPRYLCFAKDRFSVGQDSRYHTFDGKNWVLNPRFGMNDLIYAKGMYVSVIESVCYRSSDFETWQWNTIVQSKSFRKIRYGNNVFLAFTSHEIYKSSDLDNWELVYSNENGSLDDVCFSEELHLFIVLLNLDYSNVTKVLRSSNGSEWQEVTFENTDVGDQNREMRLYSVATDGNQFLILGKKDGDSPTQPDVRIHCPIILSTKDGMIFSEKRLSSELFLTTIMFCDLFFCIFGNSGVYVSTDGKTLSKKSSIVASYGAYGNGFILLMKPDNSFEKMYFKEKINDIEKLSKDSNISLSLEVGENSLLYIDDKGINNCTLRYRQKYIGV